MSQEVFNQLSTCLREFSVKKNDIFKVEPSIGSGLYGTVFFGVHSDSQVEVAIKELSLDELDGVILLSFCRELENMINCSHLFVLQFYGWSIQYPYTIYTEFAPRGSLYDALHARQKRSSNRAIKSPLSLTPTDKTRIAIGIAHGMLHIHENSTVHRDLKSSNIMLFADESLLVSPKITDYGLTRFKSRDAKIDENTVPWMAPELHDVKEAKRATKRADVYSYGIILWELLTEEIPFEDMTPVQIIQAVHDKKERPKIPSETPKSIVNLISQCWDQDPEKRPLFDDVIRLLAQNKAYFPGTNQEDIEKLNNEIRLYTKNRSKNSILIPPFSPAGIKKLKKRTRDRSEVIREEEKSPKKKGSGLDFPELPDPISPDFMNNFKKCIAVVTFENAPLFFNMIMPLFEKAMPETTLIQVSSDLERVLNLDSQMINVFVSIDAHTKLPLSIPIIAPTSLRMMLKVTKTNPLAINSRFLEVLQPYLSQFGNQILRILSPFFESFDKMPNAWEVADYIINNATVLMLSAGPSLIKIFNHLCDKYEVFCTNRLQYLISIVQHAVDLPDHITVHQAYCFLAKHFSPHIIVNVNTLVTHLSENDLMHDALSYLIRQPSCKLSGDLMGAVVRCLPFTQAAPEAIYILYSGIRNYPDTRELLISYQNQWCDKNVPFDSRVGLFLLLLADPTSRQLVAQMPYFPLFLTEVVNTRQLDKIDLVAQIILKFGNHQYLFKALNDVGFFGNYLGAVQQSSPNVGIYRSALTIIDIVSRVMFVQDVLPFIPFMVDSFIKVQNELTINAMSAITVLSSMHAISRNIIKNCNIQETLTTMQSNPSFAQYSALILQSLNQP